MLRDPAGHRHLHRTKGASLCHRERSDPRRNALEPDPIIRRKTGQGPRELGALGPRQVYFRAHNLLTSGDGTPALKWGSTNIYTEDAAGGPLYNWAIADRIFDTYLERGVRPFAQVGFMPEALSIHPQPYQHDWRPGAGHLTTGWAYPPKDYDKWRELVYQWVKHCVERYGRAEVETWYWEVWNEADGAYWKGTPDEWRKLHDYGITPPGAVNTIRIHARGIECPRCGSAQTESCTCRNRP